MEYSEFESSHIIDFDIPFFDFHKYTQPHGPLQSALHDMRDNLVLAAVPLPDGLELSVKRYTNFDWSPDKLGLRSATLADSLNIYDDTKIDFWEIKVQPGTLVNLGLLLESEFPECEIMLIDAFVQDQEDSESGSTHQKRQQQSSSTVMSSTAAQQQARSLIVSGTNGENSIALKLKF